jgi:hypothetical protein
LGRRDGGRRRKVRVLGRQSGRFARLARLAGISRGLGAHDRAFHKKVVGAADHEQVFDVVAAHDHELAMAVEVVGVDDAEPWLARAPAAAQASAEHEPDEKHHDENDDENRRKAQEPEQDPVVAGQTGEELHISIRFRCAPNRPQPLT